MTTDQPPEPPFRFVSIKEFLAQPDEPRDWGGWTLDSEWAVLALHTPTGKLRYEVDLERCLTSAETLDWIIQVADKVWATDTVVAGLVRALDDVLDPQRTLCSFGVSKKLTKAAVKARVESYGS